MEQQLDLIATATFGLEAIVSRELNALGMDCQTLQNGRILFTGDEATLARANLWLRTADRVLLRMGTFEATDFGELFDQTKALPWEAWIPADGAFPVRGRSVQSQLSSVPACQKIVKKAIVERLKDAYGIEWFEETGAIYTVEVALLKDQVTLTIDTSGAGLHKRGYRTLSGPAPLKETLAAALVLLSFWRPERPLIDPFCGTGTIPIEAALIGRNLAPGLNREFAAERWPTLSPEIWERVRTEARDLARPEISGFVMGTDSDAAALSLARHHADLAGVGADIHFQQKPFAELASRKPYGCLIGNPPYGERISAQPEVQALYASMPTVLRRLKTWSHYILTSHRGFEKLIGQEANRRRKLYNGRIECTYYQFHGPRPPRENGESAPAVSGAPAFGGLTAKMHTQADAFGQRLTKRAHHLRKWPTKQGITCYRLYERDVPEVPLIVDRYADYLHITEYDRPHEHTPAEHADWLDLMAREAARAMDLPRTHVYLKHRPRQRGLDQHERMSDEGKIVAVTEGNLQFWINLSDYIDTGLFLDHRITRGLVRDLAAGKRFLNLFAYTGAFSVYAAAGGAAATTSVDLSNTYLDWAAENLALNGFVGRSHTLIRDDALRFLREDREHYELAVIDPPTFSNSKRMEDLWDIQHDHVRLLQHVLARMEPGGLIFFSTNFRRFKFAAEEIGDTRSEEISHQTVPPDFRNRRIHRCWRILKTD